MMLLTLLMISLIGKAQLGSTACWQPPDYSIIKFLANTVSQNSYINKGS